MRKAYGKEALSAAPSSATKTVGSQETTDERDSQHQRQDHHGLPTFSFREQASNKSSSGARELEKANCSADCDQPAPLLFNEKRKERDDTRFGCTPEHQHAD
jgi:hypothetical protein